MRSPSSSLRRSVFVISLLAFGAALAAVGCAAEADEVGSTEDELRQRKAKLGEACGTGTFGTPNRACATGLDCVYPESTAPVGPPGSSSARAGTCEKRAKEGETCANGVFGTPNLPCASGLTCVYPEGGTAPVGPAGSSSARTGACERRALAGQACGTGVFGTPAIACAPGLECIYPPSTAPVGPAGSSSAVAGTCGAPAEP